MSKWSFELATWTPTAVADTTNMTGNGYCALQGGSSTQRIDISEVYLGGQAGASSPTFMTLSRDSTVGATPTALTTGQKNAALDPATAALAAPQVAFTTAGTQPQRSATLAGLNLSFNAFGGIVKYTAPQGGEFKLLGNTASLGEASLSAYTGGTVGLLGSHIIYEPL
jgi:hypothetical protein